MFDDANERTVFEPIPLGARQRVMPGQRFKAVASAIRELDPAQIIDEQVLVTERVPRLPPPLPRISRMNVRLTARAVPPPLMPVLPASRVARMLSRFVVPIGGTLVVLLLSLYLALPGHAHDLSTHIAPVAIGGETPTETFQLTTSEDQPPDETDDVVAPPAPARSHHTSKPRRPHKVIAVDSSTPLGNLRPR